MKMSFPENGGLDNLFDFFRRKELNVEWVKEQVYGKPTIPETFPKEHVRDFEVVIHEIKNRETGSAKITKITNVPENHEN